MELDTLYPATPMQPVERPIMLQGWHDLAFLHWAYDPAVVQDRLPAGLEVDVFDGRAWLGLVGFRMQRIRLPHTPALPYLTTFPELNVRTYVRDPDGRPGVWFDSLDINRLLPVLVARSSYRLAYMWSRMSISGDATRLTYSARRRWPGPRGAAATFTIRRREPIPTHEVTPRDRFLTARWGLYTQLRSRLAYAPVDHPAWPLETAELEHLDEGLIVAAGYPAPDGKPLVHYSPGVEVRIGLPGTLEI